MSSAPDIDPYAVLGVLKDAGLSDIKAAHRKLVLKCHPDKIQDESLRSKAQDEFQKVQQAYELLSDETRRIKYDQKVKLAELRREMKERGPPRGFSSREYRDGRIYEERAPADSYFDDDRFTDEPRSTTRKHDDFATRARSKGFEEKKKTKAPSSSARAAKEAARESTKATHSNRAKTRTKERKRDAYEKYTERSTPYPDSDDGGASDTSAASSYYVRVKRPSEKRSHDSTRKSKPSESSRRERRRYDDDEYSDEYESKHEGLHDFAQDYIRRSKGTPPIEVDRRHRSSRSPLRRHPPPEAPEPESPPPRRSGRSTRSSREPVRPSTSRNSSYENLEPQPRSYEYEAKVPSMPTAATSPRVKVPSSSRPPQPTRSATTASYSRSSKREGSGRSESILQHMVLDGSKRSAKMRTERYDSGYSSPGTPDMPAGASPPKASVRYKYTAEPEKVIVDEVPPLPRHQSSKTYSERPPPISTVRPGPKITRASTMYEPPRSGGSARPPKGPLFGEIPEYTPRGKEKDSKYAREYGPDGIPQYGRDYPRHPYPDDYRVPPGRRQSTYV